MYISSRFYGGGVRRMDVAQCVSLLVDVSHPGNLRYMRPEWPWQRLAAARRQRRLNT